MNLLGVIMSLVYMQAVHGWLSAYERLVNSQFFSPYLTQEDMSRFGRDYLEVGDYLEHIFPFLGIRFKSINDHYDSAKHEGKTIGMDIAFKNLIYDYYSKDLSKKVKSAMGMKQEKAKFVDTVPIRV